MNRIEKINQVIEANRDRPFKLGEWDCCIFAAEVVLSITGEDKIAEFRGKYKSVVGYQRLLRKKGEGSLYKTAVKLLGEPINKAKAWRGDVVFHDKNIGICFGPVAYFVGEDGIEIVPMKEIKIVFGVR